MMLNFAFFSLVFITSHHHHSEKNALPRLRSESVAIRFADTQEILLQKNADVVRPIASVTKLLSGVVLEQVDINNDQVVTISDDDKDKLKWSKSRLRVGLSFHPLQLLNAALGASDNRAIYAIVRAIGMTRTAFAEQMNHTAAALGMTHSHFVDPAGIDPNNVSTANDLLQLVQAASENEVLRQCTLQSKIDLQSDARHVVHLMNPDRLARSGKWDLVVGKTGYTIEAGRSLVLRTLISGRPVDMVFLGAHEMASVFGDAARVRQWLSLKFVGQLARS